MTKHPTRDKIQVMDNMTTKDRIILCASEVGGTFVLVFLGCMGCVNGVAGGPIPHEQISFTFGLAVLISVQVFGHISGSHINPIITVAAAILGRISLIQIPIFFVGQFLGAFLGFGVLMAVTPDNLMGNVYHNVTGEMVKQGVGVCSPMINQSITPAQGLLVEFIISLILILTCCGIWDSRNSDKHDSVPIRFGLMITALALAGGPYTGANMNPARSFVPALMNGDWKNHWVYWVGPFAAGVFGPLLYSLVFTKEVPSSKETIPEGIPLNQKA